MTRSEQINELATSLAKAQAEITGAKKDAENPHYKSKYADLASVWDAIRAPLTKNGLSVVQVPRLVAVGEASWMAEVESTLLHTSGQFLGDTLAVPLTRVDAQGVGSAITYARRYSLMALVGVAPDDDDANAAVGATGEKHIRREPKSAVETATVKVLGITQRQAGTDTKFIISADDRNTYGTFVKAHAETAKSAQQAGLAVTLQYRQDSYGRTVVSIEEVGADAPVL